MRVLAVLFGVGTAMGIAAGVSAAPNESRIQLVQAQDAGTQSGAGAGAGQRGSAGNREGGAAARGGSQQRGAETRQPGDGSATVRSEATRTSRTTVRERAGGTRVSVQGGTRRVVGARAATGDDAVVIRRKRARGYVYSGPSTTVIRKKRYVHYREPSSAVIIKKRRPAVAVEGVSTRTSVRSRTSTTVRELQHDARERPRRCRRSRAVVRRRECRRARWRAGRPRRSARNQRPVRRRRRLTKLRQRRGGRQPLAWLWPSGSRGGILPARELRLCRPQSVNG